MAYCLFVRVPGLSALVVCSDLFGYRLDALWNVVTHQANRGLVSFLVSGQFSGHAVVLPFPWPLYSPPSRHRIVLMAASTKRSPRKPKASTAGATPARGVASAGNGKAPGPTAGHKGTSATTLAAKETSTSGNGNGSAPVPTTQPSRDMERGRDGQPTPEEKKTIINTTNGTHTSDTTPPAKGTTQAPPLHVGSAQHIRKSRESNGSDVPEKKRKMTISDVETVQNLIEKCLQLYLTKDEVISVLREQATIDAEFTKLIWGRLEGENPQFFKCYNTRLKLKAQIQMFNHLLTEQAAVVRRMQEGWNTYPNSSATASGIPLFQSGGNFGFDDQGLKVEQMEMGDGDKQMDMKRTWSLSDFGLPDGKETGSPWR